MIQNFRHCRRISLIRAIYFSIGSSLIFLISSLSAEPAQFPVDESSLRIWWCNCTRKVFPETLPPKAIANKIQLAAAGNEYEPFQLVLLSEKYRNHVSVSITKLVHQQTKQAVQFDSQIDHVNYVTVKIPSDTAGRTGEWPDPLLPYSGPFSMCPLRNSPLWITFFIPATQPAGLYTGELIIRIEGKEYRIPLELSVYNFVLPKVPTLRSGFRISHQFIAKYHNLNRNSAELDSVLNKYFLNMAQHRVCPYNPMLLHPIRANFNQNKFTEKVTDSLKTPQVKLDFADFDKYANRYLNQIGFNSYKLELMGIGKGSSHSRKKGSLAGYPQGSHQYNFLFKEYINQLTQHLKANQWLDKAYLYWFDEPVEKDFQFLCESNAQIKNIAPEINLFLTKEPRQELTGCVDIWCLTPKSYNEDEVLAAKARGEEVWWYLCTNPKAPYPTLFIDAKAINLRMWLWMTWKYQFDGILVWQSTYWHSETAFGKENYQNPWLDPMGYLTRYGVPQGEKRYWGNGDGRFLYPPNRDVNFSERKYLEGPVNSIRWEILREGIEDFEYFALLRSKLDNLSQNKNFEKKIKSFRKLLTIPKSIITSMTEFTTDEHLLFTYRKEIAETIDEIIQLEKDNTRN